MTIFSEDDLAEVPILQRWSIFVGEQGRPFVTGQHNFHEGMRTAIDEVLVVDPLLRFVITNHGGYASPSTGNLHATLVEHHRQFPEVQIQTVDGDHDRLLFALRSQVIDVAIMTKCHPAWDGSKLPLWRERVILALPEHHPLGRSNAIRWTELVDERLLLTQQGPGPELERLLAAKLGNAVPQRLLRHNAGLDRLLSLVSADHGELLMLEGATGVRYNGVIYREVCDDEGPTRLDFLAYWREFNRNPALGAFLAMLRERYPDLSV